MVMLLAVLLLSNCARSIERPVSIKPDPPDTELTQACDGPTELDGRAYTISIAIGDRADHRTCADRHALLVRWAIDVSKPVGER
ncbi:hypothetical protein [Roseobacter sp. HKCCD7386]|uniref:hypothetical protein n=1 Tax=Roseobacter sp. HKCCD7386 TaxID=2690514 RepID=UPI0014921B98|nr:hypothetical protein [Roseobacter sp. HKCCD7386]